MKTKVPYLSILITVFLLSLLITIIPFTGKKEQQEEEKTSGEQSGEGEISSSGIITAAIKAHGGPEVLGTMRTLRMKTASVLLAEGRERAEESAFYRFPDGMRSEARIGNDMYVQTYFRGAAWIMEKGEVQEADRGTREFLRRSLKHFPNFLLAAADPAAVTLMRGTSFIEGKALLTISVIDTESDETILCISPDDFLVRRMEYSVFAGVTEEHLRLDLADFHQHAGVVLPYKVDITMNGMLVQETNVLEYELNLPLPDSLFEKPRR